MDFFNLFPLHIIEFAEIKVNIKVKNVNNNPTNYNLHSETANRKKKKG